MRAGLYSASAGQLEYAQCGGCGKDFYWERSRADQERLYCSSACSQAAYRRRVKEAAQERERKEEERRRRRRESRERAKRKTEDEWYDFSSSGGGGSWQGRDDSSAGGGSGSSWRGAYVDPVTEARATVYRLAKLLDDGMVPLKRAYRTAAKLHHPDVSGRDGVTFKTLEAAASVLRDAGLL